ncbi:uncharacterized protein LOC144917063 [Branchiostoma floridae x Branchiostoma belcheri]
MFGAGKRKTRPPARYRDDEWEVPYQPQDVSTPRDRLRLAVQKEWRDVTREVERLQADIADMNLEGEDADNASATPLPLPRRGVVERDSRTISRELDRHLGLAQKRQQTATRDPNRPSLNEIRALNRLAGIDPVLDYMGEDFAQQTAPTLRHSAQLPTQEQFEQAPVTEDDPGKALAWKLLERDTLQTQRQAFAVGTQANHRTQFRAYLAFCHYFNKPAFPATAHLLSCYAQFLGRSLKCPDSISHYLSSVKLLHQLNGVYSLDLQAFEIKQTLRGLKKTLQHRPRESRPVTPELLNRLHRHIDPANSKDATIWAILLLGFFAYFRKSNLVPSSTKAFDPHKHLRRRDIAVATEGLVLRTSWSKTVQANEREVLAPILAIPGSNLCPVSAYKNMLQLVPATPDSPAFLLPPSTNRPARPVTASILEKSFKRLLSQAGLPPSSYTIHDLRRGGYTLAFEAGVPRELRQQHGDWRSNADLLYLKLSMAQRLRLPAAMRRLLLLRTT